MQVTPETLLDFELIKKQPEENYRQFFDRMLQHIRLHLASDGAKAENISNTTTDVVTISVMNLVALQWLRKCHPNLTEIVRKEYSIELKSGTQLAALVPKIAPNIDSLVSRYMEGNVNLIQIDPNEISINQLRFHDKTDGKLYKNGKKGQIGRIARRRPRRRNHIHERTSR